MNKREFVLGSCALVCSAEPAVAAQARAAGLLPRRLPDIAAFPSARSWRAYVNQTFHMGSAQAGYRLTLREVRALQAGERNEQFTLVFDGPTARTLPSGVQTLSHANGQRLALYLDASRSTAADADCSYLAHFNLLT